MKTKFTSRSTVFLAAMLMLSVVLNVALAYKVRGFTSAQEARLARMEAMRLKTGTAVPPLTARRVDSSGGIETIKYAGLDRPTVFYVLSPTCGWCAKNEHSIKQLIAEKGSEYRFIGISLDEQGANQYQSSHPLGVPLYTGLSEDVKKAYKMGGTPQTIVVSSQGVVLANWNGAYLGKQKDSIEEFFKVELPEITLEKRS